MKTHTHTHTGEASHRLLQGRRPAQEVGAGAHLQPPFPSLQTRGCHSHPLQRRGEGSAPAPPAAGLPPMQRQESWEGGAAPLLTFGSLPGRAQRQPAPRDHRRPRFAPWGGIPPIAGRAARDGLQLTSPGLAAARRLPARLESGRLQRPEPALASAAPPPPAGLFPGLSSSSPPPPPPPVFSARPLLPSGGTAAGDSQSGGRRTVASPCIAPRAAAPRAPACLPGIGPRG